jgi:cytidylate kinase
MEKTSLFVITINRQLGSGGAYVGQQLARQLNIFYADREIISQTAKQFSVLEEDLESGDEKKGSFFELFFRSQGFGFSDPYKPPQIILPPDLVIFNAQSEIIKHIAKERSAVIIGRCGSHILREHPNHVSIFLHGDIVFRKKRIQNVYNVTEKVAEKMIIKSDKERSLYYHSFTGEEWTDARQYDISINTSKLDLDKSVKLIMKFLE